MPGAGRRNGGLHDTLRARYCSSSTRITGPPGGKGNGVCAAGSAAGPRIIMWVPASSREARPPPSPEAGLWGRASCQAGQPCPRSRVGQHWIRTRCSVDEAPPQDAPHGEGVLRSLRTEREAAPVSCPRHAAHPTAALHLRVFNSDIDPQPILSSKDDRAVWTDDKQVLVRLIQDLIHACVALGAHSDGVPLLGGRRLGAGR